MDMGCSPSQSNDAVPAPGQKSSLPHILVVGASFGGLGIAHSLVEAGVVGTACEVTAVDAGDSLTIGGCWQYVWTGRIEMEDVVWKLADAEPQLPGVKLHLKTRVTSLDLEAKSVALENGSSIAYDYLVLAPGTITDPSSIPGLAEGAINLSAMDQVVKARTEVAAFCDKAAAFAKDGPGEKPTALISISGMPYKCPPMPFEVVFLLDEMLRTKGVRDSARLVVTSPVGWPFGGPPAAKVFLAALAEKGIEFLPEHKLTKVEGNESHFASGSTLTSDLHLSTFPQRAPDFVIEAKLTNALKLVQVNLQTNRVTGHDNVFVIGDTCHAPMPAVGKPHPKAGELAFQMGQSVARILQCALKGEADPTPQPRVGKCFAESGSGGTAIVLNADFSAPVANPKEGKPVFSAEPMAEGEKAKTAWVNFYLTKFFGEKSKGFHPKV